MSIQHNTFMPINWPELDDDIVNEDDVQQVITNVQAHVLHRAFLVPNRQYATIPVGLESGGGQGCVYYGV